MRFQIKKILEGYDPAELIEQSMYCFGSDDGGGGGGSDEDTSDSFDENMGLSDQEVADATGGSDNNSNNMGIDSSVTAQQNVSANTNAQDNFSNMDNFSFPNAQNFSTNLTNVPDIGLGMVDDFGLYSSVTPDNVITDPDAGLGLNALASIGNVENQYSPSSVTGFSSPDDVSDFTTADQMTSLSPSINNPISNFLTNIGLPTTQNLINQGYTPSYNSNNQITGVMDYGIGMGMPSNDLNMSGSGLSVPNYQPFYDTQPQVNFGNNMGNMGGNDEDPIKPATKNPITDKPVCPDGYRFDDDLQACRLDTKPRIKNNTNPFPQGDAYYRATSLDNAPMNVPSGFDFNRANQDFISQFAYRPANYQNQMGLSGFTPFRRS